MRLRSLLASAVLSTAVITAAHAGDEAPSGIAIGDAVPLANVKMKNVDGKDLSIDDIRGKKGTLIVFSCNHCPWAKAWESRIVELGNAARKNGVGVMVINSNDPEAYPEDG